MIGENSGTGTNWGWGQTRDWGIFGESSPKFPKNQVGDGEDNFGEYWGPIGDGDRLEIGELTTSNILLS